MSDFVQYCRIGSFAKAPNKGGMGENHISRWTQQLLSQHFNDKMRLKLLPHFQIHIVSTWAKFSHLTKSRSAKQFSVSSGSLSFVERVSILSCQSLPPSAAVRAEVRASSASHESPRQPRHAADQDSWRAEAAVCCGQQGRADRIKSYETFTT